MVMIRSVISWCGHLCAQSCGSRSASFGTHSSRIRSHFFPCGQRRSRRHGISFLMLQSRVSFGTARLHRGASVSQCPSSELSRTSTFSSRRQGSCENLLTLEVFSSQQRRSPCSLSMNVISSRELRLHSIFCDRIEFDRQNTGHTLAFSRLNSSWYRRSWDPEPLSGSANPRLW